MERYNRFYERRIAIGMIIAGKVMKKSLFGKMLSNLQITWTRFPGYYKQFLDLGLYIPAKMMVGYAASCGSGRGQKIRKSFEQNGKRF